MTGRIKTPRALFIVSAHGTQEHDRPIHIKDHHDLILHYGQYEAYLLFPDMMFKNSLATIRLDCSEG
jgi:hypothetical protein